MGVSVLLLAQWCSHRAGCKHCWIQSEGRHLMIEQFSIVLTWWHASWIRCYGNSALMWRWGGLLWRGEREKPARLSPCLKGPSAKDGNDQWPNSLSPYIYIYMYVYTQTSLSLYLSLSIYIYNMYIYIYIYTHYCIIWYYVHHRHDGEWRHRTQTMRLAMRIPRRTRTDTRRVLPSSGSN